MKLMTKCKYNTTLKLLKQHNACADGLETLIKSLPKGYSQTKNISLLHILESNGIAHALWALKATKEDSKDLCLQIVTKCDLRAKEYDQAANAYNAANAAYASYYTANAYAASYAAANAASYANAANTYTAFINEREKQKQDLLELLGESK